MTGDWNRKHFIQLYIYVIYTIHMYNIIHPFNIIVHCTIYPTYLSDIRSYSKKAILFKVSIYIVISIIVVSISAYPFAERLPFIFFFPLVYLLYILWIMQRNIRNIRRT